MSARIISGTLEAARIRAEIRESVGRMQADRGTTPGLAVVLVGADPASEMYVRIKARRAAEVGIRSFQYVLPADASERDVLAQLDELNACDDVDGILVQLPLPAHIETESVLRAVAPAKDVDGFHPYNVGLLGIGQPAIVPCTPLGCVRLAQSVHGRSLQGLEVVVVGRSSIVGRPAAQLFLMENCTVTLAHSKTEELPAVCRRADILVVAVGRPELVKQTWVKPGATVIDVGMHRQTVDAATSRVVGDVDFASVSPVAGAITPVPGGVGPMTVAILLENTLRCADMKRFAGAPH